VARAMTSTASTTERMVETVCGVGLPVTTDLPGHPAGQGHLASH
jgi:hypothetical protein